MSFKLNASAYQQELHKSDPTSIDQVVAVMQKVSPEAKSATYSKLAVKYAKVPQNVATLFAAYPNGVALPVARVVSQDTFLNYTERNYAPVMDMGDDAFVVMDTNTGLLHQFNRKANTVCEGAGVDFNAIVKDMHAEEAWRASVSNLKATFSGLEAATESFKFSDQNLMAARAAKAKIQNAMDVVAKEGWDENKPYTLGLGASVESICKVKNSLISAEKATAALESMLDREILGLEGLDIDWQKKWDTVKEWLHKFWKAVKDFFQAMWIKIRSYIGPNKDAYKTVDIMDKVAKETGLSAELDKLNKKIIFDVTTGTFVFPDEVKQEVIEAFKAKIASLPDDKKTILKKMLNPNYKEEVKMTSSGGLSEGTTKGKATVNPGQDPEFNYRRESEPVQNSMYAAECLNAALETLNVEIDPHGFVPYNSINDSFLMLSNLAAGASAYLGTVKNTLASTIDKATIDRMTSDTELESKPYNGPYGSFNATLTPKENGSLDIKIDVKINTVEPTDANRWDITMMGDFILKCDEKNLPKMEQSFNDMIQLAEYVSNRISQCKFSPDVTNEDVTRFLNRMSSVLAYMKEVLTLGMQIIAHILKMRAACMRAMMEITDGVFKKAVMEA